jgi:hypothetical protein
MERNQSARLFNVNDLGFTVIDKKNQNDEECLPANPGHFVD